MGNTPEELDAELRRQVEGLDPEWRAAFDADVARWTAKVHFVDVGINCGGCHITAMVDDQDNVLWGYCPEHKLQPVVSDAAIGRYIMTDTIPHPFIAYWMFLVNADQAQAQPEQQSPVSAQPPEFMLEPAVIRFSNN